MFINDYYVGQSGWVTIMRFVGGPTLVSLGIYMYQGSGKFGAAYGAFCFVYGVYYMLKPAIWILSRAAAFKTVSVDIEVSELTIKIKDEVSFDKFSKIERRKGYYIFKLPNLTNVFIPTELLSSDQQLIIDTKLRS